MYGMWQAKDKRDAALETIDRDIGKKTGSRRSFAKECSPEINIACSPDDVYDLWLEFLKAAEHHRLPGLSARTADVFKRYHYRWMPATPYACLRDIFRAILSPDADTRAAFLKEVKEVCGLKAEWASPSLAHWFKTLQ